MGRVVGLALSAEQLRGEALAVRAVGVDSGAIIDPAAWNGHLLRLSGLSVPAFGVGDYATAVFTVTNTATDVGGAAASLLGGYPLLNTRESYGGLVLDASGIVQAFFQPREVIIQGSMPQPTSGTLPPGGYVGLTLTATTTIPAMMGGQSATVVVCNADYLSSASTGNAFAVNTSSMLSRKVSVAASSTGTGGNPGGSPAPGSSGTGTPTPSKALSTLAIVGAVGGVVAAGFLTALAFRIARGGGGGRGVTVVQAPERYAPYQPEVFDVPWREGVA
jgi:hypothetical protein